MRKSSVAIAVIGTQSLLAVSLIFISGFWVMQDGPRHGRNGVLVHQWELTDLCLFTEARYTRHISQADLFSPFQDHPQSFEHFPSGSLVGPAFPLRRYGAGRTIVTNETGGVLP